MSESPLMIKSKAFALEVIRACKVLREAKCESALINQFLRSGTSIGANIREAFYVRRILWKSYISLSRNAPKPNIGLSF